MSARCAAKACCICLLWLTADAFVPGSSSTISTCHLRPSGRVDASLQPSAVTGRSRAGTALQAYTAPRDTDALAFENLTQLDGRLEHLLGNEVEYLKAFYDPALSSFKLSPGVTSRISITSSCFALFTIMAHKTAWKGKLQAKITFVSFCISQRTSVAQGRLCITTCIYRYTNCIRLASCPLQ
jgi:hypothetical protein